MSLDPQKLREKAEKLVVGQKLEQAVELYQATIGKGLAPAETWCELGSLQAALGDAEGCGQSYFKAAEIYLHSGQDRYALAACQKAVQGGGQSAAAASARVMLKNLATRIKERKARSKTPPEPSDDGGGSLLRQMASSGRVQLGGVRRVVESDYHQIDTTPLPPPLSALRPIQRSQASDFVREPTAELGPEDFEDLSEPAEGGPPGTGAQPPPPPVAAWEALQGGRARTPRKSRGRRPSVQATVAPKERFMVLSRRESGTLLAGLRSGQSYGIPEAELARIAREAEDEGERWIQVLQRSMLFEGLSREQLSVHAPRERVRTFSDGEVIAATGSGSEQLLSLVSGSASIRTFETPPREISILRPGAIIGEQSFVGTMGMKTRAIALGQVRAVSLRRSEAEELLADHPASLYAMLRVVEERVVDNMLQRAGFFRLFSPLERDQICPRFEILEVADDEVIVEQGTPSKTLCLLMSGVIELSHTSSEGRSVKMLLDPGGIFGEESLIDGRPQIFTARTTRRSWIMLLRREDYLLIYERHPALVRSLKDVLRRRRRALEIVNSGEMDLSSARWPDIEPSTFRDAEP
ncbi:MAG: cyclic nucleotide-binding domain-containing protein [Polyangia bacterium]|jgi:CRP-like cAMP-binding protein|nr:cyclic nucleotide-binding domain-containing protein [Polyangia bacterium]